MSGAPSYSKLSMTENFLICLILILHLGSLNASSFELPKDVKPIEYDLTITPNLTEGTYSGKVMVAVRIITNEVDSITMHSKNLTITNVTIDSEKAMVSENIPYDFIVLKTSHPISKGNHSIVIYFNGDMKNKTYGFFRGYEIEHEKKIYFGTTFFEPINARVAFPCFDEPTFKAHFTIHIAKPPGYIALSNMNQIVETSGANNYTYADFAKTPLMSSYLVYFFVGNYSYVESHYVKKNNEIVPTRVYSPPTKIEKARYAVRQIPKQLEWFVNYTGYDYMLPKLDYITFNQNFHMEGGMENWGATSCREDSIFVTEGSSVLATNPLNMAHEFAHIWFGDLVTTSSWTQFWLNEGFARFMDTKANEIYKEREQLIASYISTLHKALWRDDESTVKPLSWEMQDPTDAFQLLNLINYEKGGSVLRMIEDTVGENVFQSVIEAYIKKYQFQNVISQDFMDVLQEFVDFNVSDFLDSFVRHPGYPLITITHSENKRQVTLTMERFLRYGDIVTENSTRWSVPIKYTTNLDKNVSLTWFNKSQEFITLNFPSDITWIKLNSKQSGYYRITYPEEMWKLFSTIIKEFDLEDRIHLIDDSVTLVRSGHVSCSTAFNIMNYLHDEEKYEAWQTAQEEFQILRLGLLQHNFTISHLQKYITQLIDKQYKMIKWTVDDNESYRLKYTRWIIFNLACYYGHEDCRKKVKELWDIKDQLPEEIKNIVLVNGGRKGEGYFTSYSALSNVTFLTIRTMKKEFN